jgi:DNA-binding transcriptional LysR family regulator
VPLQRGVHLPVRAGAAAAHLGVASLPCVLAGLYSELRPVLPDVEMPLEDVWLVSSREARQVERVRWVMAFLSEQFERVRPEMLGVR